ncbi:MAG: CYTH domain-containing protein [Clostridia bacterium]|nr:CYTH domain-containing protein [Clostridia bacterium]
MSKEIERRFLVTDPSLVPKGQDHVVKQGYMYSGYNGTVRFRVWDDQGIVTIKGKPEPGHFGRSEFEYEIPVADAEEMIATLCGERVIYKTRRVIHMDNLTWEVDFFHDFHEGLIIAEVELDSEEQEITLPNFVGREITREKGYSNAALSLKKVCN